MTLPHNEQKHNNNQLPLQHIGNLSYHKGKSATSYDSINSLTAHNNHYTLLYPDLMKELLNLALHNSNNPQNNTLFFCGLGVNNINSSSLDSSLSPRDILFFLQIVALYQLELSKGNTSITYPSMKLAKLLGVDVSCDAVVSHADSSSNTPHFTNSSIASTMRATILKITAKLEDLGLLKVFRRKRKNGMDMANKLIPVLPDKLHARLKDSPSNLKVSDSSKLDDESNLEHILRTKLFVPIELEFMKSLFKNNLPSKYKLFFLNCIMSAYRNLRQNSNSGAEEDTLDVPNMLSFSATSSELIQKNNISKRTLFNIFKYIKQQGDSFFLQVDHKYTKSDDIDSNRYDKSIFVISINPLVFPISCISQKSQSQTEEITDYNCDKLQEDILPIFPDSYRGFKTGVQKKQPIRAKKTALNNKEEIIKNKYKKNIDDIDENFEDLDNSPVASFNSVSTSLPVPIPITETTAKEHEEEFFEDKLCLSSSESYNNSSFLNKSFDGLTNTQQKNSEILECKQPCYNTTSVHNMKNKRGAMLAPAGLPPAISVKIRNIVRTAEKKLDVGNTTTIKQEVQQKAQKDKWQELRHFYPLSEQDVDTLNFRADREFSNNFMNQLLLKLYIKYPDKRFKNKFTFLSYMEKILKNEKHQGPLVNHTSFRFSCNIGTDEKNLLENEKYLNQIENSFDTSKEMQVRKKIAGRFSTEIAYKILTKVEFRTNHDNSFITALIPSQLDLGGIQTESLSERQIATLNEQLEAVYGINGYYVQEVEQEEKIEDVKPERVGGAKGVREKGKSKVVSTAILEKQYAKIKESDIIANSKDIGSLESSKALDTTGKNTVWNQVRKGLREELGDAIDGAWFSKAVARTCTETNTLILTMPTRFMADWVRNNYSHVIRRLSEGCGVKRAEYEY